MIPGSIRTNWVAVRRSCRIKMGVQSATDRQRDRQTDRQTHKVTLQLYIVDSVRPCRHIAIDSSASAPLNATEIAVMKVSHSRVVMFGPELLFLMYKCCFLACFCTSQHAQRLRAELTLAPPTSSYRTGGSAT